MSCHCVGDWNPGLGADLTYIPRHQGDPRICQHVESPKLPDDLPAEARLEVEAWGKKNSHKAKLGFLIKCIYRVYLFGRWCLGDVLLLHFLTGPHFWVPSCWSRFRSVFTMIKSSNRAKLTDEMCIFGTGGTFDPWSALTLKTRATVFYPMVFAVFLNAKKIFSHQLNRRSCVKITWSWLELHTSHKKLTPNTNLASSVECGFLKSPLKEYSYLLYHILKP